MSAPKPVQIVGGGLAGLTLGIGLRQREVPVKILEAGIYPRHRVCGEFISGQGQETIARLGLLELFEQAGAVTARTMAFFSATKSTLPRLLPSPGVCLSRFNLDHMLAKRFRDVGGELHEGRRAPIENTGEGTVHSTGRRVNPGQNSKPWFGLKIHARHVSLTADLEMHVSSSGYIGLCKINNNEVNICGLFCKHAGEGSEAKKWQRLRGQPGSILRQRLANAELDENSFCSIAGISLLPEQAAARAEISIGDAITMIPPLTGNGMSMAFESAELAIKPLAAWSRGETSWAATHQKIARDCDAAFARRLVWARWLQYLILKPVLQNPLLMLARSDRIWRMVFECTR